LTHKVVLASFTYPKQHKHGNKFAFFENYENAFLKLADLLLIITNRGLVRFERRKYF